MKAKLRRAARVYHLMRLFRLVVAARTAIVRAVPLMRDTRVPFLPKALAIALALLVISPFDVFGDIPVLGAMDDVALLVLVCMGFVHFAARHVEPIPVRRSTGSTLALR